MGDRIILLVDMDCFYVQVEQRDRPETKGKPCGVAQYNGPVGGGLIAVSYEARSLGIKRGMRSKAAKSKCPDIIIFEVPEKRNKADLTKYRTASAEVIQCISELFTGVERASIDEAYIDMTDTVNTSLDKYDDLLTLSDVLKEECFLVAEPGCSVNTEGLYKDSISIPWGQINVECLGENMKRLMIACLLTCQVRQAILKKTGFKCSAGIAPNKTLAKLACSLNKPNRQTLVSPESAAFLLQSTPISKIRNLGGKLGAAIIERFGVHTLGELSEIDLSRLENEFGTKTAHWLHALTLGVDSEVVTARLIAQSVGCSKNFFGSLALTSTRQIGSWLSALTSELVERLSSDREENQRQTGRLTLFVRTLATMATTSEETSRDDAGSFSRVLPNSVVQLVNSFLARQENNSTPANPPASQAICEKVADAAVRVMHDVLGAGKSLDASWEPAITCLGLSAGKFSSMASANQCDIRELMKHQSGAVSSNGSKQPDVLSSSGCDESSIHLSDVNCRMDVQAEPPEKATRPSFFRRLHATRLPSNPDTTDMPTKSVRLEKPAEAIPVDNTPALLETDENSRTSEASASHSASRDTASAAYFTAYTASDWTVCEDCGSRVSVWQLPEHSDFHVAQRIQQEWAALDSPGPVAAACAPSPLEAGPAVAQRRGRGGGGGGRGRAHGASSGRRGRPAPKERKRSSASTATLDNFLLKPPPGQLTRPAV